MTELKVPDYRVRLFLSVDLTGSTAFKANNRSVFKWRKVFYRFYEEFPATYKKHYDDYCSSTKNIVEAESNAEPKLWKTIGDEILFVNRVTSIAHLGAYITAFSNALKDFGEKEPDSINTKGNGWLAAFPSPNCSIPIQLDDSRDAFDDLPSEDFEDLVDQEPWKFDFLGKGIDGGFRISKNSTVETFTISPALAYLLTKAQKNEDTTGFKATFHFNELQPFKGVIGGKPYPIIAIDTNRDPKAKTVQDLEAQLLQKPPEAKSDVLLSYLEKFIDLHKIEMPVLPISSGQACDPYPPHYEEYVQDWEAENQQKVSDEEAMIQVDGLEKSEASGDAALSDTKGAADGFLPAS